jgi:hypothetical protein
VGDVAGQLVNRLRADVTDAQVALHLDDGEPGLNVDTSTSAGLRFQVHTLDLVLDQVQRRSEQEQPDIALDGRLRTVGVSRREAHDDLAQINLAAGHTRRS